MNQRNEFIQHFFKQASNLEYAFLKYNYTHLSEISDNSDIDLAIKPSEKKKFLEIIRRAANINKVSLHPKSFVTFVSITFNDNTYLEIDLIHRFDRKGTIFLSVDEVISQSHKNEDGITCASLHHSFEYVILFYLLNGSSIPEKHQNYFSNLSSTKRSSILAHMCQRYGLSFNVLDELYSVNGKDSKKVLRHINNLPINKGISQLCNQLRYLGDVVRDIHWNKGVTISFSGVDGAGKSTVLDSVNVELQKKYRKKTVVLRHRPSILPILSTLIHGKSKAEKIALNKLPRQGSNVSTFSSFFRFMYYYTDYILGQFYIYFKYTIRGYAILYDRYYFDFIIDSKRSNIVLPQWLIKWCYALVFKPNVNVFLYAEPKVILSRKQEMSKEDIEKLTKGYRNLFEEYGKSSNHHHYIAINNIDINKTLDIVMKEYVLFAL